MVEEVQQTLSTWAEKNHHGKMWKAGQRRRWFMMHGFHVRYYRLEQLDEKTAQCGTFDLRNMRVLQDSRDASAPTGAIDLVLSEKKGGSSNKVVTLLLPAEAKEPWLRHMCSAASDDALPPAMRGFRSLELATKLDDRFATQKTASSTYGAARAPRSARAHHRGLGACLGHPGDVHLRHAPRGLRRHPAGDAQVLLRCARGAL